MPTKTPNSTTAEPRGVSFTLGRKVHFRPENSATTDGSRSFTGRDEGDNGLRNNGGSGKRTRNGATFQLSGGDKNNRGKGHVPSAVPSAVQTKSKQFVLTSVKTPPHTTMTSSGLQTSQSTAAATSRSHRSHFKASDGVRDLQGSASTFPIGSRTLRQSGPVRVPQVGQAVQGGQKGANGKFQFQSSRSAMRGALPPANQKSVVVAGGGELPLASSVLLSNCDPQRAAEGQEIFGLLSGQGTCHDIPSPDAALQEMIRNESLVLSLPYLQRKGERTWETAMTAAFPRLLCYAQSQMFAAQRGLEALYQNKTAVVCANKELTSAREDVTSAQKASSSSSSSGRRDLCRIQEAKFRIQAAKVTLREKEKERREILRRIRKARKEVDALLGSALGRHWDGSLSSDSALTTAAKAVDAQAFMDLPVDVFPQNFSQVARQLVEKADEEEAESKKLAAVGGGAASKTAAQIIVDKEGKNILENFFQFPRGPQMEAKVDTASKKGETMTNSALYYILKASVHSAENRFQEQGLSPAGQEILKEEEKKQQRRCGYLPNLFRALFAVKLARNEQTFVLAAKELLLDQMAADLKREKEEGACCLQDDPFFLRCTCPGKGAENVRALLASGTIRSTLLSSTSFLPADSTSPSFPGARSALELWQLIRCSCGAMQFWEEERGRELKRVTDMIQKPSEYFSLTEDRVFQFIREEFFMDRPSSSAASSGSSAASSSSSAAGSGSSKLPLPAYLVNRLFLSKKARQANFEVEPVGGAAKETGLFFEFSRVVEELLQRQMTMRDVSFLPSAGSGVPPPRQQQQKQLGQGGGKGPCFLALPPAKNIFAECYSLCVPPSSSSTTSTASTASTSASASTSTTSTSSSSCQTRTFARTPRCALPGAATFSRLSKLGKRGLQLVQEVYCDPDFGAMSLFSLFCSDVHQILHTATPGCGLQDAARLLQSVGGSGGSTTVVGSPEFLEVDAEVTGPKTPFPARKPPIPTTKRTVVEKLAGNSSSGVSNQLEGSASVVIQSFQDIDNNLDKIKTDESVAQNALKFLQDEENKVFELNNLGTRIEEFEGKYFDGSELKSPLPFKTPQDVESVIDGEFESIMNDASELEKQVGNKIGDMKNFLKAMETEKNGFKYEKESLHNALNGIIAVFTYLNDEKESKWFKPAMKAKKDKLETKKKELESAAAAAAGAAAAAATAAAVEIDSYKDVESHFEDAKKDNNLAQKIENYLITGDGSLAKGRKLAEFDSLEKKIEIFVKSKFKSDDEVEETKVTAEEEAKDLLSTMRKLQSQVVNEKLPEYKNIETDTKTFRKYVKAWTAPVSVTDELIPDGTKKTEYEVNFTNILERRIDLLNGWKKKIPVYNANLKKFAFDRGWSLTDPFLTYEDVESRYDNAGNDQEEVKGILQFLEDQKSKKETEFEAEKNRLQTDVQYQYFQPGDFFSDHVIEASIDVTTAGNAIAVVDKEIGATKDKIEEIENDLKKIQGFTTFIYGALIDKEAKYTELQTQKTQLQTAVNGLKTILQQFNQLKDALDSKRKNLDFSKAAKAALSSPTVAPGTPAAPALARPPATPSKPPTTEGEARKKIQALVSANIEFQAVKMNYNDPTKSALSKNLEEIGARPFLLREKLDPVLLSPKDLQERGREALLHFIEEDCLLDGYARRQLGRQMEKKHLQLAFLKRFIEAAQHYPKNGTPPSKGAPLPNREKVFLGHRTLELLSSIELDTFAMRSVDFASSSSSSSSASSACFPGTELFAQVTGTSTFREMGLPGSFLASMPTKVQKYPVSKFWLPSFQMLAALSNNERIKIAAESRLLLKQTAVVHGLYPLLKPLEDLPVKPGQPETTQKQEAEDMRQWIAKIADKIAPASSAASSAAAAAAAVAAPSTDLDVMDILLTSLEEKHGEESVFKEDPTKKKKPLDDTQKSNWLSQYSRFDVTERTKAAQDRRSYGKGRSNFGDSIEKELCGGSVSLPAIPHEDLETFVHDWEAKLTGGSNSRPLSLAASSAAVTSPPLTMEQVKKLARDALNKEERFEFLTEILSDRINTYLKNGTNETEAKKYLREGFFCVEKDASTGAVTGVVISDQAARQLTSTILRFVKRWFVPMVQVTKQRYHLTQICKRSKETEDSAWKWARWSADSERAKYYLSRVLGNRKMDPCCDVVDAEKARSSAASSMPFCFGPPDPRACIGDVFPFSGTRSCRPAVCYVGSRAGPSTSSSSSSSSFSSASKRLATKDLEAEARENPVQCANENQTKRTLQNATACLLSELGELNQWRRISRLLDEIVSSS